MPEEDLQGMYAQNDPQNNQPNSSVINRMQMEINQLRTLLIEASNKRLSIRPTQPPRIKARRPDPFKGNPSKLKLFLTSTNIFFSIEAENFLTDKS
jgi:hypothetical protein